MTGDMEYPNDCHALNAGADDCRSGTCKPDLCACTMNYNPVKCGDKTYGNVCNAKCKDDRHKPVCCQKDASDSSTQKEYRNSCWAKCSGEEKDSCRLGSCDDDGDEAQSVFGSLNHLAPEHDDKPMVPVITINAMFIGLIIVAVVAFVVIYAQKVVKNPHQKMAPRYDSDL